jgi:MoaA/NifB/PqqE/SkfB family radical SAM enzyme
MFKALELINIATNVVTKRAPLYVQYYITARCDLRCEQCNIIYANADRRELNTEESFKVIDNLAKMGTSVVLLTGGEPFARQDLPRLAGRLIERNVHPRIQTNGFASEKALSECADFGVRDISISLDSLRPTKQDFLNGGFEKTWNRAITTISNVSNILGAETFAAFGTVFSPFNYTDVPQVIEFATEIGWWVSLVPAHSTTSDEPRSFSSFSKTISFSAEEGQKAVEVLDKVIQMKKSGMNVYDSDIFLEDLKRYIMGNPMKWRDRNSGCCDAGDLYFAVLPDGEYAPCCDWRIPNSSNLTSPNFISEYKKNDLRKQSKIVAAKCSGCLYGSYPEITIAARYAAATAERLKIFSYEKKNRLKLVTANELETLARKIIG